MGMMFKTYANYYKGRNGALQFHNGKPILSVKYSLWDGADTAQSIAAALNANTHRDAYHDSASFTIVNVHPWSVTGPDGTGTGDPMSNLNALVQLLDPTKVDVVTLEDMMVFLRNNFGTPVGLPGDYNNDNRVDTADYALWRKTAGTTNLAADGNGDGIVDTKDFDVWRAYFGKTFTPADLLHENLSATTAVYAASSADSLAAHRCDSFTIQTTVGPRIHRDRRSQIYRSRDRSGFPAHGPLPCGPTAALGAVFRGRAKHRLGRRHRPALHVADWPAAHRRTQHVDVGLAASAHDRRLGNDD